VLQTGAANEPLMKSRKFALPLSPIVELLVALLEGWGHAKFGGPKTLNK
jgi:hypothetical protein